MVTTKETVKEALDRNYKEAGHHAYFGNGFERGVSWQAERSYSKEEFFKFTLDAVNLGMGIRQNQLNGYSEKSGKELHKEWFSQFNK